MTQLVLTAANWLNLDGLRDLVSHWKQQRERKALMRRTKRELMSLTDHELKDIGVGRSDIISIANGTFYDDMKIKTEVNKNLKGWV